jgi:hypothetical protein
MPHRCSSVDKARKTGGMTPRPTNRLGSVRQDQKLFGFSSTSIAKAPLPFTMLVPT